MEIDNDGRQKKMDKILRELMEDDIGKKLKKKVMDWKWKKKKLVEESTGPRGSSSLNFLNFLNELFISKRQYILGKETRCGLLLLLRDSTI